MKVFYTFWGAAHTTHTATTERWGGGKNQVFSSSERGTTCYIHVTFQLHFQHPSGLHSHRQEQLLGTTEMSKV